MIKQRIKKAYIEAKYFSPIPKRRRYFLIVAQERTGSTLLSDLASFHPDVLMDRHYFYKPDTWTQQKKIDRPILSRKPIRGFKFKVTDAPLKNSPQAAHEFFQEIVNDVKVIRLTRKDRFRHAISFQMTSTRSNLHVWKNGSNNEKPNSSATWIDVDDLLETMNYFHHLTEFQDIALEGIPHLRITYETDLLPQDQHQKTANRVFDYLDISSAPVETRLQKLTSNDLDDIIANMDEVSEALENTRFEKYVAEYV